MCGIVGYVGKHKAAPLIIEGLKRLEYRGYDSAGVAVFQEGKFTVAKKTGRVANLEKEAAKVRLSGTYGMGHTRWATHGGVTDANAHPHLSSDGQIVLIHNGVIENYAQMKKFLLTKGYTFQSETDTEVLCNLIAYHYAKEPVVEGESRFVESVRKSLRHAEGTYGIVVMSVDAPGELVTARKGSPLILGIGEGESLVASDVAALISRTQNVVYLKDGEIAHLRPSDFSITTLSSADVAPVIDKVNWSIKDAELGDYAHFMEKEIFEQPMALENTMRGRFSEDGSTANFGGLNVAPSEFRQIVRLGGDEDARSALHRHHGREDGARVARVDVRLSPYVHQPVGHRRPVLRVVAVRSRSRIAHRHRGSGSAHAGAGDDRSVPARRRDEPGAAAGRVHGRACERRARQADDSCARIARAAGRVDRAARRREHGQARTRQVG